MVVNKSTCQEYAIKFFLSATDFKEESALYEGGGQKGGTFSQFLPKVRRIRHWPVSDSSLSVQILQHCEQRGSHVTLLSMCTSVCDSVS